IEMLGELENVPDTLTVPYVFIVEGESDTQTLFYRGYFALGMPGAKNWKPEYAELELLKQAKVIFVMREAKQAGAKEDAGLKFATAVSDSFPPGKVRVVTLPVDKDPSAMWIRLGDTRPGFHEELYEAFANSTTIQPAVAEGDEPAERPLPNDDDIEGWKEIA